MTLKIIDKSPTLMKLLGGACYVGSATIISFLVKLSQGDVKGAISSIISTIPSTFISCEISSVVGAWIAPRLVGCAFGPIGITVSTMGSFALSYYYSSKLIETVIDKILKESGL